MLVYFKEPWKDSDGNRYRKGWVIVSDDVAAEAKDAKALDTSSDLTPPDDYAALWAEQNAAEREAKRDARRRASEARKAGGNGPMVEAGSS